MDAEDGGTGFTSNDAGATGFETGGTSIDAGGTGFMKLVGPASPVWFASSDSLVTCVWFPEVLVLLYILHFLKFLK